MNSYDLAEHMKLLCHHFYARVVDEDPNLLEEAKRLIEQDIAENGSIVVTLSWRYTLKTPWPAVREEMLRDDFEGRLLRSFSPFSVLIGKTDPRTLRKIREWSPPEIGSAGLREVVGFLKGRFSSYEELLAWLRSQPLAGFDAKTGMELIEEGRASDVIQAIQASEAGVFW